MRFFISVVAVGEE